MTLIEELNTYRMCVIEGPFMRLPVELVDRVILQLEGGARAIDEDVRKQLTPCEFRVYEALATANGELVDSLTLRKKLAEGEYPVLSNVLRVHVCRLRNKLKTLRPGAQLVTARGHGYFLV